MAMMPSGELSAPSTERNMTSSGEYGRTVAASIVGSKRFFGKIAYRQPRTVRGMTGRVSGVVAGTAKDCPGLPDARSLSANEHFCLQTLCSGDFASRLAGR
jgi:hypothetical protein